MPNGGAYYGAQLAAIFNRAVVPKDARARGRDRLPPVVLLPAGGADQAAAATLVRALDLHLHQRREINLKSVPHAVISAASLHEAPGDVPRLASDVADQLRKGIPRGAGRLRLRDYWLVHDALTWTAAESGPPRDRDGQPQTDAEAVRDHCYALHRKRTLFQQALWWLGGTGTTGPLAWWHGIAGRFVQDGLQKWYGWRCTRRMLRSKRHRWFGELVGVAPQQPSTDFFEEAHLLAAEGGDRHEQGLIRALLADLRRFSSPGRGLGCFHPWRRRRNFRIPILIELPKPDIGKRGRWLLEQYAVAAREVRCASVMVVAVGLPGDSTEGCIGLDELGTRLAKAESIDAAETVRVLVPRRTRSPERVRQGSALPAPRLVAPGVEAAAWAMTGLALLGMAFYRLAPWPEPTGCLGGQAMTVPAPSGTSIPPDRLYDEVVQMINEANREVEQAKARDPHVVVRTVVHLGAKPDGSEDARYDAAVPELRGVALAQQRVNAEAATDMRNKVRLRLELVDAGNKFRNAKRAAEKIKDMQQVDKSIVGVVGLGQSRRESEQAIVTLGNAGIPMIGTMAAADAMTHHSEFYRQVAPTTSREAAIASEFARHARIIEGTPGHCSSAQRAVIIQDPDDLYSRELGKRFQGEFNHAEILSYSPDSGDDRESPMNIAERVCSHIRENPKTVVFWAERALEFMAFVDNFSDYTDCAGQKLTVLGGDDLANANAQHAWLRLYHASRALPADELIGYPAQEFADKYQQAFNKDNLWRDDGNAALGHDAMRLMSLAVNRGWAMAGRQRVFAREVQIVLESGEEMAGASGYLDFSREHDASPERRDVPPDKPVTIVYETAHGPEPVLACGNFDQNDGRRERWGPDGRYSCPRDN